MAVLSDVAEKVGDLLPGQIGTGKRWTGDYVDYLAISASRIACERCDLVWNQQEISLEADVSEYDLSTEFVQIVSVEFSEDGSEYDDFLTATTMRDLDELFKSWKSDTGSRPRWYCLLSCPGLPESTTDAGDGAKIRIHRPPSSVDSQKIRVNGYATGTALEELSLGIDQDIMDMVHVPYVMAILLATSEPERSVRYFQQFKEGCDRARARAL